MITITFLIIAFLMRGFFIQKKDPWGDRLLYYLLSVALTPLIGPFLYKIMRDTKAKNDDDPSSNICWPQS